MSKNPLHDAPLSEFDAIQKWIDRIWMEGYQTALAQAVQIVSDQAANSKHYTALNKAAGSIREMKPTGR